MAQNIGRQNSMMQSNLQQGAGSSLTAGLQAGVPVNHGYLGAQNGETVFPMPEIDGPDGVSNMDNLYFDPIADLPDLPLTNETNLTGNSGHGRAKNKGKSARSNTIAAKRSKQYREKKQQWDKDIIKMLETLREQNKQLIEEKQEADQRADRCEANMRMLEETLAKKTEAEKSRLAETMNIYKMLDKKEFEPNKIQSVKDKILLLMLQSTEGNMEAFTEGCARISLKNKKVEIVDNALYIKSIKPDMD